MNFFVTVLIRSVAQLLLFTLIPFIWWLITDRKANFFQWLGLKKPCFKDSLLKTVCLAIGVCLAYTLGMYLLMSYINPLSSAAYQLLFGDAGISVLPSILVSAIISTGLSEEIFFRGFLCKRLSKRFGFVAGNTIQAFFFGLINAVTHSSGIRNILIFILMTLLSAAMGYFLGWLNEKRADGSIIPSWFLNSLMDTVSELLTYY